MTREEFYKWLDEKFAELKKLLNDDDNTNEQKKDKND